MRLPLFAVPNLAALMFCATLIGLIYAADSRRHPRRHLVAFLLSGLIAWNLGQTAMCMFTEPSTALFWARSNWTTIPFFSAVFLHLALVFPERAERVRLISTAGYAAALAVSILVWTGRVLIAGVTERSWQGFAIDYGPAGPYAGALLILIVLSGIGFAVRSLLGARSAHERRQALWLIVSPLPLIFAVAMWYVIVPLIGNVKVIPAASAFSFLSALISGYAIIRHRVLDPVATGLSQHIVSLVPGMVFMLDLDQRILHASAGASSLLGYQESDLVQRPLITLLDSAERVRGLPWQRWNAARRPVPETIVFRASDGRPFPMHFLGSLVQDAQGDISGFVALCLPIDRGTVS